MSYTRIGARVRDYLGSLALMILCLSCLTGNTAAVGKGTSQYEKMQDFTKEPLTLPKFSIDSWIGLPLARNGLDLGLAFTYGFTNKYSGSLQVASDVVAIGFGRQLQFLGPFGPIIGINYSHSFASYEESLGIYMSLIQF